jgi:two-component system chemotaxis response regulator CheY
VDKNAPILLVDDSPAILALLRDLLKGHGFKDIRTATSAEEGLKLVAERHPDLIFLDLMMPDSSGIEFTRAVLETSPASRVVLTTALPPTHEAVMMAVSQGAADYLPKPLRDETLSLVLDHWTKAREGAREENVGYY